MSDEEERLRQRAVEAEPDSVAARARLAVLEDRLGRPRGSMLLARVVSRPGGFMGEPGLEVRGGTARCVVVEFGQTVTLVVLESFDMTILAMGSLGPETPVRSMGCNRGDVISLRASWVRVDEDLLPP